jgi:mannose-6-phosphate isomerase-like protein (cupin superfamily)
MNKTHSIFCDIDGTILHHLGNLSTQITNEQTILLTNIREAFNLWDKKGYKIILTTGRRESTRAITEKQLSDNNIFYDNLIMNVGNGNRILINDKKPDGVRNTAYAVNVVRNKGLYHYDFSTEFVTIPDQSKKLIIKPWGSEELVDYNDKYVVKKICMKANECCSLQYHELKRETICLLSGKLKLYIGSSIENLKQLEMNIGDTITIEPYTIHRMEGIEDSIYLETSTNELHDVVRLNDKYDRISDNILREK